jgi:prolipoprotein diacylglyceryltransferase
MLFWRECWQQKLFWWMMIFYGLGRMVIDILFKDFGGDNVRFWATMTFSIGVIIIGLVQINIGNKRMLS